jgi:hypothetical protein
MPETARERLPRCGQPTRSGASCTAAAIFPDGCLWHSRTPEAEERRAQVASEGGRARSNRARATAVLAARQPRVLTIAEVGGITSSALAGVVTGRMSPTVAGAIAGLVRAHLSVIEAGELEQRIAALEGKR